MIELFAYAALTIIGLFVLLFIYFNWFWRITFEHLDLEEDDF